MIHIREVDHLVLRVVDLDVCFIFTVMRLDALSSADKTRRVARERDD
jgi:hypothetical protein